MKNRHLKVDEYPGLYSKWAWNKDQLASILNGGGLWV
jgi:hypothetical protein